MRGHVRRTAHSCRRVVRLDRLSDASHGAFLAERLENQLEDECASCRIAAAPLRALRAARLKYRDLRPVRQFWQRVIAASIRLTGTISPTAAQPTRPTTRPAFATAATTGLSRPDWRLNDTGRQMTIRHCLTLLTVLARDSPRELRRTSNAALLPRSPLIELYLLEAGSCPPADRWLRRLLR